MSHQVWAQAEDDALRALYAKHDDAWSAHLREHRTLHRRSVTQCAGRMRSIGIYRFSAWPAEGVRIFFDDPRAVRDHGSLERLGHPEPMYSSCGCSARWAVAS